jgi:hypothetical protein
MKAQNIIFKLVDLLIHLYKAASTEANRFIMRTDSNGSNRQWTFAVLLILTYHMLQRERILNK